MILIPFHLPKSFSGQIFAALIVVYKANIKLTSMYGIFGIYELPVVVSVLLSIFTILVIINAFNLIDGINGLSGSIGALIALTLGSWFLQIDRIDLAIVAFALTGSTIAFLKYNVTPAKIFMGDTGSLLLGLVCSILAIEFIESHKYLTDSPYAFQAAPSVAVGILILPLFDTLRVFTIRALSGRSPFSPDRNHIHHLLIDSGLSHMQATGVLLIVNMMFIFVVYKLQKIGTFNLLVVVLLLAIFLTSVLSFINKQKRTAPKF